MLALPLTVPLTRLGLLVLLGLLIGRVLGGIISQGRRLPLFSLLFIRSEQLVKKQGQGNKPQSR